MTSQPKPSEPALAHLPLAPSVNLNLNVRGLAPSATLGINEQTAGLAQGGQEVFKLGLGQSPFPVPEPVVEALRTNANQREYLPVRGLPALREAVADYYHRQHAVERHRENVLIGPGSKELMFLLQVVYYGDLVVPTPSWVSYAPQAQMIGRHVRWLVTSAEHNWQLQPDDLECLCRSDPDRPRIVVLNYPTNPTGRTYGAVQLKALAEVARRYRVIILSDEIYGEIHHEGAHVSIAEFYPEGTIISTGLSKWCGAGGWRLGTFTFPDQLHWLLDAMAVAASETFTATSAPIQFAAVTAFAGGPFIDRYLVQCRRILKAVGAHCTRVMQDAGVEVQPPEGAFYLFPDLRPFRQGLRSRGIHTNAALCDQLLKDTGVATLPGVSCGRAAAELTLRMAYVDFDGAAALRAAEGNGHQIEVDEAFVRSYCPRVVEAMDRVAEWVASPRGGS